MKEAIVSILEIVGNTGQIAGLPRNPRKIGPAAVERLKRNIAEFPEMLGFRKIIVVPADNGKFVAVCGNARLRALREMRATSAECIVLDRDTPPDKLRAYAMLDNVSAGEWSAEILAEWPHEEVVAWAGADILGSTGGAPTQRKGWGAVVAKGSAFCDMKEDFHPCRAGGTRVFCSYIRNIEGRGLPLAEIKTQPHVSAFARAAVSMLRETVSFVKPATWCLITTPKRRHGEWHFASEVCAEISRQTRLPFYNEAVTAKNRGRIRPEFTLAFVPPETNVVVYDDIVTTGSTLRATRELLADKNVLTIAGIDNC